MKAVASRIAYNKTGYFSEIICDYLEGKEILNDFTGERPDLKGFQQAVKSRNSFPNATRKLLHAHLLNQYKEIEVSEKTKQHIDSLLYSNCFTVCTAHQPSLFTGTLYFIYKILHAIKLAETLKKEMPENNFVPVFWMGSEDADLEELGMCYLNHEKLIWNTDQKGAVGRMKPEGLEALIERISHQLSVLPYGNSLVTALKKSYLNTPDIQTGTFHFIHELFNQFGLIVVIPDQADLKRIMSSVFKSDLFEHLPFNNVSQTNEHLQQHYKVQANPRPINLFYLKDQLRERIESTSDGFRVLNSTIQFTKEELEHELEVHPERFSPNVFLRSLFQEILLPNLAYIGGGGELAYWMELKKMFEHYKVPYPLLVLRNSFLLVESNTVKRIEKLPFDITVFFKSKQQLLETLLLSSASKTYEFSNELKQLNEFYDAVASKVEASDTTLKIHVSALKKQALNKLEGLAKKVKRKEKTSS